MPDIGYSVPLGARISMWINPPGRKSSSQRGLSNPRGPHQRARCTGLVHASKTSARGALKTRVMTISLSVAFGFAGETVFALIVFRLGLDGLKFNFMVFDHAA